MAELVIGMHNVKREDEIEEVELCWHSSNECSLFPYLPTIVTNVHADHFPDSVCSLCLQVRKTQ
jgi:hypothetical protein